MSWLADAFGRAPLTVVPHMDIPGEVRIEKPCYLLGLDLGQRRDFSALVIAERTPPKGPGATYALRHLQRWRLGTPYGQIVEDVRDLLSRAPLLGCSRLILDETGVGIPIREMFDRAGLGCPLTPVMITAGSEAVDVGRSWHVPKQTLAATIEVLLQSGRLRIAPALPDAAVLTRELQDFEVRITPAGNAQFGVWRSGRNDDLVLATALAAWGGEQMKVQQAW